MTATLSRTLNSIGLIAICLLLTLAFYAQFANGELPCPLCILQRAGFGIAGFGIALNVLFGARPAHYGIAILGAVAGGSISVRQIFLHITPGSGAYGDAIYGMHLYTWAFLAFFAIVLGSACLLLWERHLAPDQAGRYRPRGLAFLAVGWFALLMLGNGLSTYAECTTGLCPDDPAGYLLFNGGAAR